MKQLSLADEVVGSFRRVKETRREKFLREMDGVIPWTSQCQLLAIHYPKGTGAKGGRPALDMEVMLRIHYLTLFFNLADEAMEEALYEQPLLRRFARLDIGDAAIPDATSILGFRHLLERHHLAEALLTQMRELLRQRGFMLKTGTIVDATLIAAPTSTKNEKKERDPEMHSTKKGNQWYFGMKAHIGVDADSGLVHTVKGTSAEVSDVSQGHALLHGEEEIAFGDAGYQGIEKRPEASESQPQWHVALRPSQRKALDESKPLQAIKKQIERIKSGIRAKVEHPFRVMKQQFGFRKVRYRGLAKNTARIQSLMMVVNLWMIRNRPLPVAGQFCLEGGA